MTTGARAATLSLVRAGADAIDGRFLCSCTQGEWRDRTSWSVLVLEVSHAEDAFVNTTRDCASLARAVRCARREAGIDGMWGNVPAAVVADDVKVVVASNPCSMQPQVSTWGYPRHTCHHRRASERLATRCAPASAT